MAKTVTVRLSDAAIKKYATNLEVGEINDPLHPVRFRYKQGRQRGSYYVVTFSASKATWRKIANYPDLPVKNFLEALPKVLERLAIAPKEDCLTVSGWATVGDLLAWYAERITADGNLSQKRKATSLSALRCHLVPKLGALPWTQLSRANLDKNLVWPMQSQYSLAHVRLVLGVLKVAFKRAHSLSLISENPMAGVVFTDFTKAKILPKPAQLQPADAASLISTWGAIYTQSPAAVAIAVMMLAHGTRIGETRLAKWKNVDLVGRTWHIPVVDTKTKQAHNLPLTEQAMAFLTRYRMTQKAKGYEGEYLFPGTRGRPVNERQACDYFSHLSSGAWTSHDLRKLARTGWLELGVDYMIGELLLNHALKTLDATYIHTHAEERKRDALERWHHWLDVRGFQDLHLSADIVKASPVAKV